MFKKKNYSSSSSSSSSSLMTYFLAFLVDISSSPSAFLLPDPSPSWTEEKRTESWSVMWISALLAGADFKCDQAFGYATDAFWIANLQETQAGQALICIPRKQEIPVLLRSQEASVTVGFLAFRVLRLTAPCLSSGLLHLPHRCRASWLSLASEPCLHPSLHHCLMSRSSPAPLNQDK